MKTILYYCLTLLLCISVCNDAEAKKKKYPNGDVYEGEWKRGQPEGRGKMVYANGNVYEGEWKEGKHNGKGKMIYKTKDIYEGEWKDNKEEGHGKMTYASGTIYEGEWRNDQPNGQGKITYVDGGSYEGEWFMGKFFGVGKMIYPNGNVYVGEWKNNREEGHGKMTYANGDVYEGEWKKRLREGIGKITYTNGKVYEGEWKNDKPEGKGQIIYANGDKCEWKNGEIRLLIHPNVNNISEFYGIKNENGTMTGKVNYTNNNCFYTGDLKNYRRQGEGTFCFASENCISGMWKSDSLVSGSGDFVIAENAVRITKDINQPFKFNIKISENNKVVLIKIVNINQKFPTEELYNIASSEIAKIKENLPQELQRQMVEKERLKREEKDKKEKQEQEEKEQRRQELIKKYGVKFANAIMERKIIIGMTKDMVREIRSRWTKTSKSTTARGILEIWKYYSYSLFSDYYLSITFFDGKVVEVYEN